MHPRRTAQRLTDTLGAIREVVVAYIRRAPHTPLSGDHGPGRLLTYSRFSFFDFKDVAKHYGGTINDVVIGVTAGALRKWLIERGHDPGEEHRALAPISTRRDDEHDALGNRLVGMRIPVPVQIEDPDERMRYAVEQTAVLKTSKQEMAGHVIWNLNECFNDLTPPILLKPSARINFSTRLFNLILTNFPGPNFPLWVMGRPVDDIIAYGFLARGHRIMISTMSFHGRIAFALLADDESMADVERIAELLQESFREIQAAAGSTSDAVVRSA
jgi:WS/DGAT/MGAT family acyltransferase